MTFLNIALESEIIRHEHPFSLELLQEGFTLNRVAKLGMLFGDFYKEGGPETGFRERRLYIYEVISLALKQPRMDSHGDHFGEILRAEDSYTGKNTSHTDVIGFYAHDFGHIREHGAQCTSPQPYAQPFSRSATYSAPLSTDKGIDTPSGHRTAEFLQKGEFLTSTYWFAFGNWQLPCLSDNLSMNTLGHEQLLEELQ